MKKIISVVGPTASGKTALSICLAKEFNAEIVSVDSMQIYRLMNVGTAKVTSLEQQGIPHHMIDCFEPYENCNVQKFISLAREAVDDVISRGKNCVLAGGTGLYVDHLISDTKFVDVPTDLELREKLSQKKDGELWTMLENYDPISFARLHYNDKKRIIRALEVVLLTGKSIAYWDELSHLDSDPLDAVMIGLNFVDRDYLYERIEQRVDNMVQSGLVEEVKQLMQIEGFEGSTASAAIGYKEIISALKNGTPLEESIEKIKLNTRRYAKRQLTWFRRNKDIHWIDICRNTTSDDVFNLAFEIIQRS